MAKSSSSQIDWSGSAYQAVLRELRAVYQARGTLWRIRVTPLAPQGAVLAVPSIRMPERSEVLVHPEDWRDILCDKEAIKALGGGAATLYGIPVEVEG